MLRGTFISLTPGDRRIRRVDAATQTITTVAGNGTSGYSGDGGAATSAEISRVYGIVVDGTGNLYIADSGNSVVRKVDATTQTITTVVGNGTQGDIWPNHNSFPTATSVELNWPEGLAVDAAGNLYIVDSSNQRILKVDAATQTIYAIAGDKGHACSSSTDTCDDGNPSLFAYLDYPEGIALDGAGNLYIADTKHQPNSSGFRYRLGGVVLKYLCQFASQGFPFAAASNIGNTALNLTSVATAGPDFTVSQSGSCFSWHP